ncbi:MAG: ABC transporter permease subunit, partial [Variovorax sp.]
QTVPSLALLALLISWLGVIGIVPALIALTLYALLPIMRNTVTGLTEVPSGVQQAGTALGLTATQNLRVVLLPLAMPTLIAGIRTATTIAIGTATIAAFIGAGGYGERIVTGLALNDSGLLVAGALPAAALALLSEAVFESIEYLLLRRHG